MGFFRLSKIGHFITKNLSEVTDLELLTKQLAIIVARFRFWRRKVCGFDSRPEHL